MTICYITENIKKIIICTCMYTSDRLKSSGAKIVTNYIGPDRIAITGPGV